MTRARQTYSGWGYWVVQIGFAALLALLGIGGGVVMLLDDDGRDSESAGSGILVFAVGVVFLLLLVWLIAGVCSQSRTERAVYAWTIMQEYAARGAGGRPVNPGRTVTADLASLASAERARHGELDYAEVLRLQALRPDVPYPGDLEALRLAAAERETDLLAPGELAERRRRWEADDAAAVSAVERAGLAAPGAERVLRRVATASGVAAIVALFTWQRIPVLGIGAFLGLVAVWTALRAAAGACRDARTRRGLALVAEWRAEAPAAERGLPAPYAGFVRTPLGAWWMRLITPLLAFGLLLIVGAAANLSDPGAADDRGVFVGMASTGAALVLVGIALRWVAARRSAASRSRLAADRGPRGAVDAGHRER